MLQTSACVNLVGLIDAQVGKDVAVAFGDFGFLWPKLKSGERGLGRSRALPPAKSLVRSAGGPRHSAEDLAKTRSRGRDGYG